MVLTSFSGGRSLSTRREPPTMGKQLASFITCGCESSAPFFVIMYGSNDIKCTEPKCKYSLVLLVDNDFLYHVYIIFPVYVTMKNNNIFWISLYTYCTLHWKITCICFYFFLVDNFRKALERQGSPELEIFTVEDTAVSTNSKLKMQLLSTLGKDFHCYFYAPATIC
jgi:hypothetical protein